ncbi:MAG: hypothetical protein KY462_07485 [Actinobacteria bacterium]|nr:hypothetical protein [Actinomycetota bacterium]
MTASLRDRGRPHGSGWAEAAQFLAPESRRMQRQARNLVDVVAGIPGSEALLVWAAAVTVPKSPSGM